jgi:predicted peptidase
MRRIEHAILCIALLTLLLSGCSSNVNDALIVPDDFLNKPLLSTETKAGIHRKICMSGGILRAYAIYVPENYTSKIKWPLIIFHHGSNEMGIDGREHTKVGIGPVIRDHPDWFPCVVLMPQVSSPIDNPWKDQLNKTLKEYNIDKDRISMTGISLGGNATWTIGAAYSKKFSALMPICGWGNPFDAPKLTKVPIRVFHGEDDHTVPIESSEVMFDAIRKLDGNIEFIKYEGVGHNSWSRAYRNKDNIDWLLSQVRQ